MKKAFAIVSAGPMVALLAAVTFSAAGAIGCGNSDASPFAKDAVDSGVVDPGTGGGSDSGSGGGGHDSGTGGGTDGAIGGGGGGIGCNTTPTRYVVLGHSVAHCFAVGGVDSPTCALKNTQTYLATKFPGITYENYAVDGAVIADVKNTQLANVKAGPGHIFVNLYIGGNDLAAHLYETDAMATKSYATLKPQATADLETIVASFDDKTKYPDGATIMVNSQYNPFDECVAGQYAFVTLVKQQFIKDFNDLFAGVIANHPNAVLVDQYTTFLGHGHNFDQSQCPKFISGAAGWMADLIHPNEAGHVNLSAEMKATIDNVIYKCN